MDKETLVLTRGVGEAPTGSGDGVGELDDSRAVLAEEQDDSPGSDMPAPLPPWSALRAARLLYRTHRRSERLPWHPSATAAVGFVSTVAGATYASPSFDAVAVMWRATPLALARAGARLAASCLVAPAAAGLLRRSWRPAAVVAGIEFLGGVVVAAVYQMSWHQAQRRWLSHPRHEPPDPADRIQLVRWRHLIGLGVAAETPHAADAMCQVMADHADLPIYVVASTPAHVRLFRRFGFSAVGPSWYGETPMVRPPGPLREGKTTNRRGDLSHTNHPTQERDRGRE